MTTKRDIRAELMALFRRNGCMRRLKLAGFRAGRPFRKAPERNQFCVPIYWREQVARFLRMVEETETCQPAGAGDA